MQKQVSKQSLAIVALSILLAICMALTATYALFQSQKTVTGSITFVAPTLTLNVEGTDGDVVDFTAAEGNTPETVEITFTQDSFEYVNDTTVRFTQAVLAELYTVNYWVTVTNIGSQKYGVDIAVTGDAATALNAMLTIAANQSNQTADIAKTNIFGITRSGEEGSYVYTSATASFPLSTISSGFNTAQHFTITLTANIVAAAA